MVYTWQDGDDIPPVRTSHTAGHNEMHWDNYFEGWRVLFEMQTCSIRFVIVVESKKNERFCYVSVLVNASSLSSNNPYINTAPK